jgi:acyl-CoA thioester hydrolase
MPEMRLTPFLARLTIDGSRARAESGRSQDLLERTSVEHKLAIRVRYPEVDGMGYLHHSRYLQYFEMGRVELLRSLGHSYADLERQGVFFVVVKAECRYKAPARFDDELLLTTRIVRQTHVRIDHSYEIRRGETLIAEGTTTIACVGRDGQLEAIPPSLAFSPVSRVEPETTTRGPDIGGPVVDLDWQCVECGYNLRTLSVEGRCPECGELVSRSLGDDNYLVALAERMAGKGLDQLLEWLRRGHWYRRCAAAYAIATMGSDARPAVSGLIEALNDSTADVRWWAAYALGKLKSVGPEGEAALRRAMGDPDPEVCSAASEALGKNEARRA